MIQLKQVRLNHSSQFTRTHGAVFLASEGFDMRFDPQNCLVVIHDKDKNRGIGYPQTAIAYWECEGSPFDQGAPSPSVSPALASAFAAKGEDEEPLSKTDNKPSHGKHK